MAFKDYPHEWSLVSFLHTHTCACVHTCGPLHVHICPHTKHKASVLTNISTIHLVLQKLLYLSPGKGPEAVESNPDVSTLDFCYVPSCRLLKTGIFFWAAGKSAWGREKTPWSTGWPPCSSGWRLKKWDQQCGGGKRKHQAALKETEGSGGKTSNCSHPERKTCWCWYRLCVQVPFLVLSDRWLYPLGSLPQQWTQLNSLH